jgi:hypothetical protein
MESPPNKICKEPNAANNNYRPYAVTMKILDEMI